MSQLATTVSRLKSQGSGKLPSQTVEKNASAITLRSGKELKEPRKRKQSAPNKEAEKEVVVTQPHTNQPEGHNVKQPKVLVTNRPFPTRLNKSKKEDDDKKILETFRKVEVNIPLLDAIKQVPRYAKFLKEICINKIKLKGNEKISVGENISAILQKKLPPKCKDPCMFTIPCKVSNVKIEKAMLGLGASINVISLFIYSSLNLGSLKETGVIIQLADRSNVYPEGVLKDVLVQVNELVFPVDFYVLDMEEDNSSSLAPILIRRPFLKTAKTKIDVHDGTLTIEFDGEIIKFNIYDTMRYPSDVSSVCVLNVVDPLVQDFFYRINDDKLKVVLNRSFTLDGLKEDMKKFVLDSDLQDAIHELESLQPVKYNVSQIELPLSHTKLLPSIMQAPKLELKPLLDHLKYAFLGEE